MISSFLAAATTALLCPRRCATRILLVQSEHGRVAGFANALVLWILCMRKISLGGRLNSFSIVAGGLGLWGRRSGMCHEEQYFAGISVGQGELEQTGAQYLIWISDSPGSLAVVSSMMSWFPPLPHDPSLIPKSYRTRTA